MFRWLAARLRHQCEKPRHKNRDTHISPDILQDPALLDARAVLACMAYVDLNPMRAAMASTPEQSDYTSIQERILHPEDSCLRPFAEQDDVGIPFGLKDYLELVDWGGREIKHNKRGDQTTKRRHPQLLMFGDVGVFAFFYLCFFANVWRCGCLCFFDASYSA